MLKLAKSLISGVKLITVAEHNSLICMGCKATKTGVLMKWPVCASIYVLLFGVLISNILSKKSSALMGFRVNPVLARNRCI